MTRSEGHGVGLSLFLKKVFESLKERSLVLLTNTVLFFFTCVFKGKDARVFMFLCGTGKGHACMFGYQFEVPVDWTICLGALNRIGIAYEYISERKS